MWDNDDNDVFNWYLHYYPCIPSHFPINELDAVPPWLDAVPLCLEVHINSSPILPGEFI